MANEEQVKMLHHSVEEWNNWRTKNPDAIVDLSSSFFMNLKDANLKDANLKGAQLLSADLSYANLRGVNLSEAFLLEANLEKADLTQACLKGANLNEANLSQTDLIKADLSDSNLSDANLFDADLTEANLDNANLTKAELSFAKLINAHLNKTKLFEANLDSANLTEASLTGADFSGANLNRANLTGADLAGANLSWANLDGADLKRANLYGAKLVRANLDEADLSGANLIESDLREASLIGTVIDRSKISGSLIYGINIWDLNGNFEEQKDLIITPRSEFAPVITVDNVKVAQFIYLILNNEEIRDAINTLVSKSVLILGRFSIPERKAILDVLRNKLREYDLLPIVFDFVRPTDKDFTETIKTLAGLCYFVIADVTNPKSSPLELQATVPDYQIPFVPIIQEGESPFAMMADLQKKYNWVLNTVSYDSQETLMKVLKPLIIDPAMKKRQELRIIKVGEPEIISAKEYLDEEKKNSE